MHRESVTKQSCVEEEQERCPPMEIMTPLEDFNKTN
jgi:hypothetical protein